MAAAKKKKPTAKQITEELQTAAKEYKNLQDTLWAVALTNAAERLGVDQEEIEEEFGALT